MKAVLFRLVLLDGTGKHGGPPTYGKQWRILLLSDLPFYTIPLFGVLVSICQPSQFNMLSLCYTILRLFLLFPKTLTFLQRGLNLGETGKDFLITFKNSSTMERSQTLMISRKS